jgi:pyrroline-5-carboxylate reductase
MSHNNKENIVFIGAGNMATSFIGGMVKQGIDPKNIWASDPNQSNLDRLSTDFGICTTLDNNEAIAAADVLILAVKPQVMKIVLAAAQPALATKKPLLISIAAGITLESLDTWSAQSLPIVRCMPNTPSLISKGASGLFANTLVNNQQKALTESILNAVGICLWVNTESDIDAVTAVSGSGPAYYFLMMEAMIEAGQKLGLTEESARKLTLQTALGASQMASESDVVPSELRRRVTSPGGTTEQAINTFIDQGLHQLVENAMQAAATRSQTLAEELGD